MFTCEMYPFLFLRILFSWALFHQLCELLTVQLRPLAFYSLQSFPNVLTLVSPRFISCMARLTFWPAFAPYLFLLFLFGMRPPLSSYKTRIKPFQKLKTLVMENRSARYDLAHTFSGKVCDNRSMPLHGLLENFPRVVLAFARLTTLNFLIFLSSDHSNGIAIGAPLRLLTE